MALGPAECAVFDHSVCVPRVVVCLGAHECASVAVLDFTSWVVRIKRFPFWESIQDNHIRQGLLARNKSTGASNDLTDVEKEG